MWIAVFIVALILYTIKTIVQSNRLHKADAESKSFLICKQNFLEQTSIDHDLRNEIEERIGNKNYNARINIVKGFMGDDDPVWDKFALAVFNPAACVLAAKHGKVFGFCCGIDAPGQSLVGPRSVELTERFVLKLEEELQKHGVQTFIVGSYHGKNNNVPVRKYVAEHGFGSTHRRMVFDWANNDPRLYKQLNT